MSIQINTNKLTESQLTIAENGLRIELIPKYATIGPKKYHYAYELNENGCLDIPYAFAKRTLKLKPASSKSFGRMDAKNFDGDLREEQIIVKNEAIDHLNKTGSVMISMHVGAGKTITSINIARTIGLKTLVIVNKIVLMNQWSDAIKLFCGGATVQILKPKSKKIEADFYIINAINIEKFGIEFFKDIGCVIVDEAHMIMASLISRSLLLVHPRYLIGLTATPYRPDGLDGLLDLYFGSEKIIRELYREHIVYKVETGFTPETKLTTQGRLDWNAILDSQSKDETRNELIISIIKDHPDRNFLVLVKRVEQGKLLEKRLIDEGESATSLLGSNQMFEKTARVLIGTCSKVGTGFDHPKLDTLLLAADVEEYFIQYLGRCMRTRDNIPVVFDLVDDNPIILKHYNTRRKIYKKHGGIVKKYN